MIKKRLATISLSWDEFGNISHTLDSEIPANNYQQQDALALSVPLVFSSQLGILNPRNSLELCGNSLDYFAMSRRSIFVIQSILKRVNIELHQKDKTIVSTFHPELINGDGE